MICRSWGGVPRSAWQVTASAYVPAVSYQAEQSIPPEDRLMIMSEVLASIINFVFLKSHTKSKRTSFKAQQPTELALIAEYRRWGQLNKQDIA